MIWKAYDQIRGKQTRLLAPTLVGTMVRHGHVQLAAEVGTGLLAVSAATMGWFLRAA